ncbi:hypothetical protein [Ferroplasma sp.]|uniref:hypothetical protein n=1 Tax=Ferroplasma sp. TaxID=2591003 RepID=UPI002635178C|nr:hypothetical protein [Ferroplasma sp.]
MSDEDKWVVTYGTELDVDLLEYPYVCDSLENILIEEIKKCYPDAEYLDDERSGETLSIRYELVSKPNPPNNLNIRYNKSNYKFERLELEPMQVIYPDYLHELFNKYLDLLNDNLVPFSDLSIDLLIQALESYSHDIYEGTVILCRSIIDSSLYLAIIWKRKPGSKSLQRLCLDIPTNLTEKGIIKWGDIKEAATNILYKNEINKEGSVCILEDINKSVRELGNFAAHIGERQMKEYSKWFVENKFKLRNAVNKTLKGEKLTEKENIKGYKLRTSKNEAELALEETVDFLIDLVNKYLSTYP